MGKHPRPRGLGKQNAKSVQPSKERIKGTDTGTFVTIVAFLVAILFFLLQSNGITRVAWIPSLLVYLLCLGGYIVAFVKWKKACRPVYGWALLALSCAVIVLLSAAGVREEYRIEHNPTPIALEIAKLPDPEVKELDDLNHFIGGKDSFALDNLFGFEEMLEFNVKVTTDRIFHLSQTGKTDFDVHKYDGQYSGTNIDMIGGKVREHGGGLVYDVSNEDVTFLLLSKPYSENRANLERFKDSGALPQKTIAAIAELDETIELNAAKLMKLLNGLRHQSADYFIHYNDPGSPYWQKIRGEYFQKTYVPLKPKADAILASMREALNQSQSKSQH